LLCHEQGKISALTREICHITVNGLHLCRTPLLFYTVTQPPKFNPFHTLLPISASTEGGPFHA
jgi:hypothetical protein